MTRVTRTEIRKRGVFGWVVLVLFWAFNALMAFWMIAGLGAAGRTLNEAASEAEQAGAAVGTAIGAMMILVMWGFGALILGLMVLLTRGRVVVIESRDDPGQ